MNAAMITTPLTAAQHGIWMGQQLAPDNPAYWTGEAMRFTGAVDAEVLCRTIDHVLRHAQSLHLQINESGQACYPCEPPPVGQLRPVLTDRSDTHGLLPTSDTGLSDCLSTRPRRGAGVLEPLFEHRLYRVQEQTLIWVLWAHHLTLDGFGFSLIESAIVPTYQALLEGNAPPCLNHWRMQEVITEDQRQSATPAHHASAAFWQHEVEGTPALSVTALDAIEAIPLPHTVRRSQRSIPSATVRLWQAQEELGPHPNWMAWLLQGIAEALFNRSQQATALLGWPVMNRMGSAALRVPCMHMNILPLKLTRPSIGNHDAWADHIRQQLTRVRRHQRFRHEDIARRSARLGGKRRLFGPVINLMPFETPRHGLDIQIESIVLSAGPVDDLAVNVRCPAGQGDMVLSIEANPYRYDDAFIDALADDIVRSWAQTGSRQDPAPLSPHTLLHPLPQTAPAVLLAGSSVLGRLAETALRHPTLPAVEHLGDAWTYGELWTRAQALATQLHHSGVTPQARVLLCLQRRPDTLALMLAVWLTGGCVVPLAVDTPPQRRQWIVEDVQPDLVVLEFDHPWRDTLTGLNTWTRQADGSLTPASSSVLSGDSVHAPLSPTSDRLAYVMFTSGSTGRPKGVGISHLALNHFLASVQHTYRLQSGERMLQFAPLHFDASVEELFLPLCHQGTVVMRDEAMLASPQEFMQACQSLHINILDLPTAYWHVLTAALAETGSGALGWPDSLRLVIIGGEAAQSERIRQWRSWAPPHVRLINTYGPTESTVICAAAELSGPEAVSLDDGVPIGQPIPGVCAHLLPAATNGTAQPADQALYELWLSGPTLSTGYLHRPELTAERFQMLNERLRAYRTGDLVRLNASGDLVYMGRVDDEVKISGLRIDPAEIESALLAQPQVRAAAVVTQSVAHGDKRLAAFVVTDPGEPWDESALRDALRARLPAAAVPSAIIRQKALPLNANNKVDRIALLARLHSEETAVAPVVCMTDTSRLIQDIWRSVLGPLPLSAHSDFFDLGGASLQAIQVCARLGTALQREVPTAMLFAHPTIEALAVALDRPVAHHPPPRASGHEWAALLPIQRQHDSSRPPLFCIHPAEGLAWCYHGLCRHITDREIWGLQAPGILGKLPTSWDEMIDHYVDLVRQTCKHPACALLGWSSGGGIAHAVAARLQSQGWHIDVLAMMDSQPASTWEGLPLASARDALAALLDVIGVSSTDATGQPLDEASMRRALKRPGSSLSHVDDRRHTRLIDTALHGMHLYRQATHPLFQGDLLYFKAQRQHEDGLRLQSWQPWIAGTVHEVAVDSDHNGMSQPKPLAHIAQTLGRFFRH